MIRPLLLALAALLAAVPMADAAAQASPAAKPPRTISGVERAQRCMEMKHRLDEAKTKTRSANAAKAAKPTEREKQDLDWYRKHCR
jgi:hypothetical protein